MKHLIRRFFRFAELVSRVIPGSWRQRRQVRQVWRLSAKEAVPKGHVPLDVGNDMDRFVVSAELLNHPVFVGFLNRAVQEYGYSQKGVLHIPCHVVVFERMLDKIRQGRTAEASDIQDLFSSCGDDYLVSAFEATD